MLEIPVTCRLAPGAGCAGMLLVTAYHPGDARLGFSADMASVGLRNFVKLLPGPPWKETEEVGKFGVEMPCPGQSDRGTAWRGGADAARLGLSEW